MKRSLFAALCLLCLISCGEDIKHKENIALAVGGPQIDFKTDWAWLGLLANPREVQYEDGTSFRFDPKGNSHQVCGSTKDFNGRVRTDLRMSGICKSFYDESGRLVRFSQLGNETEYTYQGDAYYPSSMKMVLTDTLGRSIVKHINYTYDPKDFDEHGNWLSRKEDDKTVTRTIKYFLDPYFVPINDLYMSPKTLAKVYYNSEIKGDAERAISTFDMHSRKSKSLTVHRRKKLYEAQDADNSRITRFSVKNVKMDQTDDGQPVAFVTVKLRNAAGKGYSETIRCFQQKDGSWLRDYFTLDE